MAEKKLGFFGEFKKFITRGNIVDMSVGVIVGGAFTAIVNGLSNFILKPIINWILALITGSSSLDGIFTYLRKVEVEQSVLDAVTGLPTGETETVIDLTQSIYIDWGSFINAIINFLLVALTLFVIIKVINSLRRAADEAKAKALAKKEEKVEEVAE